MRSLLTILAIFVASTQSMAQETGAHYYFDGDDVVFEFNLAAYLQAKKDLPEDRLTFSDLQITNIVLVDTNNQIIEKGWRLSRIDNQTYQLRKKIKEFGKNFDWQIRYLINQKYWVKPDKKFGLLATPIDALTDLYEYHDQDYLLEQTGPTRFFLKGNLDAQKVILTGSFNNWNESELQMKPTDEGWQLDLHLPTGRHEYKFIVDGKWMHDPENPNKVLNNHFTHNSVLDVTRSVTITLKGYEDAKKVILAGTFNDWDKHEILMDKTEHGWEKQLELISGKYHYKFIVDGHWIVDPDAEEHEYDRKGNKNSVLYVN